MIPPPAIRPRRSVLFAPGANARAMDKARTLDADAVILDLEDAVAPEAKAEARTQAIDAVRVGGYGHRELVVRVNGLDTPWGRADLAGIAPIAVDAVLLPKVESAEMVREALGVLDEAGALATTVWCMLETPRGILAAAAIATTSRRVGALVMGTSDLTKELHARPTRDRRALVTSLELCVLAARAAGITALDGVHLDLDDDAGFDAACVQAAELGFDGKTLIHPRQIARANERFAPSEADLAWAHRIMTAHGEARARGQGVTVVDGRLIENLHVEDARRVVALAEAIAARTG